MAEKNRQIMKKETMYENEVAVGARLRFTDGQVIERRFDTLKPAIVAELAAHGWRQKVGDGAASFGSEPEKAFEACITIDERLGLGDWKKAAEKGEGARPTMVFEAIRRAYAKGGKDVEISAIQAAFSGDDGEEKRKAILKDPRVKAEYEALRAEAAAKRAEAALAAANAAGDLPSF